MKVITSVITAIFVFAGFCLNAEEVIVTPSSGESFILDVDPTESFLDVVEEIQNHLVNSGLNQENDLDEEQLSFSYTLGVPGIFIKRAKPAGPRNYGASVNASEKENIRYIIRSLAKYNWAQLAKEESSLKKAGDKITHIHPFRFLQSIFTDEELKTGLFVIRNKSLVWSDYYDGLKKSLNEESDLNNLVQFTPDFANNIGVNVNLILPYVQTRQWSVLIDVLIANIPRQGNPDRYGM